MDICLGGLDCNTAIFDMAYDQMERQYRRIVYIYQSQGSARRFTHQGHSCDERWIGGDLQNTQR